MKPPPLIKHLYSVERWTLVLAALLCATGLFALSSRGAMSLAVGAGLSAANAWAIRGLGARFVSSNRAGFIVLAFNAKLLVIGLLIFLAMHFLPIQLLPLMLGISVLPVAVLIVALRPSGTASTASATPSSAATEESHG